MKSRILRFLKPGIGAAASDLKRPALDGTLDQARALHQSGDLNAAAALYDEIIAAYPESALAHYRLANLLKDRGEFETALNRYDQAIALKGDYAHAYCNKAVVLGLLNRLPEALASYDRAIGIDPGDAIALCNRGMLQNALGRKDEALASFDAVIALDRSNFTAHFARAALLQERRAWPESVAAYDRAIAVKPDDALAHYNRGTVQRELKNWHEASNSYGRAIALNDDFALAHASRGEVLQQLGQHAAALGSYDRALALDAKDSRTHHNRAVLLQVMGRFDAALAAYNVALELNPAYAEAWSNRGTVLRDLDDLRAALNSYDRAIAVRPDFADAHLNRGVALQDMGLLSDAIESYQRALSIDRGLPEGHYNLALASLTVGDYATGWREYEWRWQAKGGPIYRERRSFAQPLWLGEQSLAGRTILLYGEQGLGDTLQFCRYVPLVARAGGRVILEVPVPLVEISKSLPGVAEVIAYGSSPPKFDLQCPLMSLPLAFGTLKDTIPAVAGYLRSNPDKVTAWRHRLGSTGKLRVGLAWSGNQAAGTNRKRHFSLSSLIPHLPRDYEYYCLQTEVIAADQATIDQSRVVTQFEDALHDFSDTAALCECMDLVISVDTSVAHLSGALGKETWVLLAAAADWRWFLERDDSPWYRSLRLFRQAMPGDWDGVFNRVASALRARCAR